MHEPTTPDQRLIADDVTIAVQRHELLQVFNLMGDVQQRPQRRSPSPTLIVIVVLAVLLLLVGVALMVF